MHFLRFEWSAELFFILLSMKCNFFPISIILVRSVFRNVELLFAALPTWEIWVLFVRESAVHSHSSTWKCRLQQNLQVTTLNQTCDQSLSCIFSPRLLRLLFVLFDNKELHHGTEGKDLRYVCCYVMLRYTVCGILNLSKCTFTAH